MTKRYGVKLPAGKSGEGPELPLRGEYDKHEDEHRGTSSGDCFGQ
jgi:hypothetical protein